MRFFEQTFVDRARAVSESLHEELITLTTRITECSAPTMEEGQRAQLVATLLTEAGFEQVTTDSISNVTARIPGKDRSQSLLLAGHTDTVFPMDTPIHVERSEDRLAAPGVGDNSVSVAAVILLRKALEQLNIVPETDLVVTGNVGEEGLGDLRGIRAVVDALPELGAALAVEGHSLTRVTHRGIGSRRYEIVVSGPGGHSWGDAGRPSALHHLASIVTQLDELPLRTDPKTSLNVGTFHSGISVNTIAGVASALLDMRSEDESALGALEAQALDVINADPPEGLEVTCTVVGNRPAGSQPLDTGIVPIARQSLTALGLESTTDASSTDANVPISRGIPAICIGLTAGGNVHKPDEFIRLEPLKTGFTHLILTTLAVSEALAHGAL